jgi:hypothetical protein
MQIDLMESSPLAAGRLFDDVRSRIGDRAAPFDSRQLIKKLLFADGARLRINNAGLLLSASRKCKRKHDDQTEHRQ